MSLPRLLTGVRPDAALSLREHTDLHGRAREASVDLIDAVARSGLLGRGGASFPAAVKMTEVARRRGPRSVLVNAAESEPMSAKDRALLQGNPHLVLDGAIAVAEAVAARSILIAIREDAVLARSAVQHALNEREARQRLTVATVPVAHLSGQESALIRHLSGGPLKPTLVPPLPVERGLRRRPTLVQNPETLAHVALIHRHGPGWFRELGTPEHAGSALVTLSGAVPGQGVYEIACATPLGQVLDAAGSPNQPLSAVLVGGYHGAWVAAGEIDSVTLDNASLSQHGGSLGAGVVVALGRSACPVQELAATIAWLASESAGQCGPCSHGLPALANLLAAMAAGRAPEDAWQRLLRWTGDLPGRGACHLPDGAVRFLRSGMGVFGEELSEHQRLGPCHSCRRPTTLRFADAERFAKRAAV
jgi:NADH:ubiquinone oxidoreductase subunit F (NADH-binding)